MPSYIVTCPSKNDVELAKKHAEEQGGKIGHTFTLGQNGFSVEFPRDSIGVLKESEHILEVENDGDMKTQ